MWLFFFKFKHSHFDSSFFLFLFCSSGESRSFPRRMFRESSSWNLDRNVLFHRNFHSFFYIYFHLQVIYLDEFVVNQWQVLFLEHCGCAINLFRISRCWKILENESKNSIWNSDREKNVSVDLLRLDKKVGNISIHMKYLFKKRWITLGQVPL